MGIEDRIIGAESGGNATAKNPRSSATGAGQFISSTWLDVIRRHRPDLAGLPPAQVLGLRNDPGLSREMTAAYASDNAAMLQSAGYDPTPGNQYLAHFAGPAGAKSVLGADPSTPVSQVLPASSIQANPFLAPMTAGDLMGWAAKKVGGAAPTMTMPGATPAASGQFGVSGPEASAQPAMPMTVPAEADTPIDAAKILQTLFRGSAQPQAQAQAIPAPPPLPTPLRQAVPFDPSAFYALLQRKRL